MKTESQQFFDLLSNYPRLESFWDKETKSADFQAILNSYKKLSKGETIILKCLYSIWRGTAGKTHTIDITDLALLDAENKKPLLEWIINPFFP